MGHIVSLNLTTNIGLPSAIFDTNGAVVSAQIVIPRQDRKDVLNGLTEVRSYTVFGDKNTRIGNLNFSKCEIQKEVEHSGAVNLDASVALMVNSDVKNTSDLFNQYFLVKKMINKDGTIVHKTDDEIKEEIKSKFFNKNMKNLPIPLMPEWKDFFWNKVKESLIKLDSYGNSPYVGFKLRIPSLEELHGFIEIAHASYEFQKYHKRVPQMESLLVIGDIRGFKLKEWMNFLKSIGGMDEFKKLNSHYQETVVRSFEIFGGTKKIMDRLNILYASSLRSLNIKFRVEPQKGQKDQWRRFLSNMLSDLPEDYLIRAIENFDMLLKDHTESMKRKAWGPIKVSLDNIMYDNINPRLLTLAKELSELKGERVMSLDEACSLAGVSEQEFYEYTEEYLETVDKAMTAPKEFPTISSNEKKTKWEMIDMSDPRGWIVGLETNCCQHLGSAGSPCVIYAAKNPSTSGIFRVHEKGKTIAQSFFWIERSSKDGEYILVFDNIEALGTSGQGTIRDSVLNAYKEFVEIFGAKYAKMFKVRAINVGTGFMEPWLSKISTVKAKDKNYAPIPRGLLYSDAKTQMNLATFELSKNVKVDSDKFMKTSWEREQK